MFAYCVLLDQNDQIGKNKRSYTYITSCYESIFKKWIQFSAPIADLGRGRGDGGHFFPFFGDLTPHHL